MGQNFNVTDTGILRAGDTTNNVTLDPASGVTLNGTAKRQKRVSIPASAFNEGDSKPPVKIINSNWVALEFDAGRDISLAYVLPNDYEDGSDLSLRVLYSPTTTETGITLTWEVDYLYCEDGVTDVTNATTNVQTTFSGNTTQNIFSVSNFMTINGSSFTTGNLLQLKILMAATSTANKQNVYAFELDYTVNKLS